MKFTALRVLVAAALVVLMAAPVALCVVNPQSQHSCCEGMMDDQQPVNPSSCCVVQAPTQPSVTTHASIERVILPSVAVAISAPISVQPEVVLVSVATEISPPGCCSVLRI